MNNDQVTELLLQSIESEKGGILLYENALECAINEDLRVEWTEYLDQTRNHYRMLTSICQALSIDPEATSPGRAIVRNMGKALVDAMQSAMSTASPEAAQLVACECVVMAETKDHFDWELIGKCAARMEGKSRQVLVEAIQEIENQEDEHLYHSKGWLRELWLESLGLTAILPPPEDRAHVTTAIEAAQVQHASEEGR